MMVPLSKQVFLYSQCVDEDMCSYSQKCMDEDMCSYSQQCVEENTVLTQGRIILWARGSLANDGSTVKTSVPIFKMCG